MKPTAAASVETRFPVLSHEATFEPVADAENTEHLSEHPARTSDPVWLVALSV